MAVTPIPSKGVALLQSVSAVYVAMQGLTGIEHTGRKSETYEVVTLDGPVTKQNPPSGYANAAVIKATGLYNPSHATYTAFEGVIATPVETNFKTTWTDSAPTSVVHAGTGFGIDLKTEPSKGVMASIEIVTSGNPA